MIELARSTWTEVAAHMKSGQTESGRTTAFLPFGALEQHGPHLPLSTDTLQCGEIARRLAERTDGILLPAVHYGETWGNSGHPGTISLAPSTVTAIAVLYSANRLFSCVGRAMRWLVVAGCSPPCNSLPYG